MKKPYIIIVLSIIILGLSCRKNSTRLGEFSGEMELYGNCNGMFLIYQDKRYLVCNDGIIDNTNSSKVWASFTKLDECPPFSQYRIGCYLYTQYEFPVKVLDIRPLN